MLKEFMGKLVHFDDRRRFEYFVLIECVDNLAKFIMISDLQGEEKELFATSPIMIRDIAGITIYPVTIFWLRDNEIRCLPRPVFDQSELQSLERKLKRSIRRKRKDELISKIAGLKVKYELWQQKIEAEYQKGKEEIEKFVTYLDDKDYFYYGELDLNE